MAHNLYQQYRNVSQQSRNLCESYCKMLMEDMSEDEGNVEELKSAMEYLKESAMNRSEVDIIETFSKKIHSSNNNNNDIDDICQIEEEYEQELSNLKNPAKINEIIESDENVKKLTELIKELTGTELDTSKSSDSNMEEGEGFSTTQVTLSLIDPISKKQMTNPVRNIRCGHVYDKGTIMSMLKHKKNGRVSCPYYACTNRNPIRQEDLERALDYERALQRLITEG